MTSDIRTCIYLRSASENDHAIRKQRDACEDQARLKGWQVISTHFDHGGSGNSVERTGLTSLWQAVEAGACDVILAQDLSRIYRDEEKYLIFSEACQRQGVELHFLNGLDISSLSPQWLSELQIKRR